MTSEELEAFYIKHHRQLYLVALGITMSREHAEDAVHSAMEKLLCLQRQPKRLTAYVFRSVRNSAIDLTRSHRRHDVDIADLFVPSQSEPIRVSPAVLSTAFLQLRANEREAVWLHIYVGMSFREISELQKRSINTVASRYRRGIARLQKLLDINHETD